MARLPVRALRTLQKTADMFAEQLAADRVPSIHAIRAELHVGQPRAQRLRITSLRELEAGRKVPLLEQPSSPYEPPASSPGVFPNCCRHLDFGELISYNSRKKSLRCTYVSEVCRSRASNSLISMRGRTMQRPGEAVGSAGCLARRLRAACRMCCGQMGNSDDHCWRPGPDMHGTA